MNRKPHQHQVAPDGERFDCTNPDCRLPFKIGKSVTNQARGLRQPKQRVASREEQNARYLDCGPQNWDDRESPSGDY